MKAPTMRRGVRIGALLLLAVVVATWVAVSLPAGPTPLAANGPITFARSAGRDADLFEVDAATGSTHVVVSGRGTVSTPAWSRDGRSLAYAWRDPTQGGFHIRVIDVESGDDRVLTPGDAIDGHPTWSPDGERIAFASNRGGKHFGIFVIRSDGSDPIRLLDGQAPAWSPSGRWIAFVRLVDGRHDLFLVQPDGSGERRLTADPGDDIDPAWTPDGSAIVFASDRAGDLDLYRLDVETGTVSELLRGRGDDRDPAVSPDGLLVAFSRIVDGHANLWLTNATGEAWQLTVDRLFDIGAAWQPRDASPTTFRFAPDSRQPPHVDGTRASRSLRVFDPTSRALRRNHG